MSADISRTLESLQVIIHLRLHLSDQSSRLLFKGLVKYLDGQIYTKWNAVGLKY